jgi:hypothetical protein
VAKNEAPHPLPVEVVEDKTAPSGDLVAALAALLLDRARKECQNVSGGGPGGDTPSAGKSE